MTKLYIISTHKLDPSLNERVFGIDPSLYRKEIKDNDWLEFFHFMDGFYNRKWHCFYELPARSGSNVRVIAVHDLPTGNSAKCPRWMESLCRYFSEDEDDVTFILHDLDLLSFGRNHFYHETCQFGRRAVRVFGFHHGDDDIIGRRICSTYQDSDDFAHIMEPVLKVAHLNTILEDCSADFRYPNQDEDMLLKSQIESDPRGWNERFPDASSCDYLDYLESLCLKLLKPYFT